MGERRMSDERMQEAEKLFEIDVGRLPDSQYCWRARGVGMAEFCRTYEPNWPPIDDPEGWIYVGPYRSERAVTRDSKRFERAFMQARYPDREIVDAPDPRSLH
jgi:hypothetical protein